MSRAQTNIEFMVLMAVVIVISLIAYFAVGNVPSIFNEMETRSSDRYWSSSDISVIAKQFNGTDGKIILYNNMDDVIIVNSFMIDGDLVDVTDKTLNPGEKSVFSFDYVYDGKTDYSFSFVVIYENLKNGNSYSFYGKAPLSGTLSQ